VVQKGDTLYSIAFRLDMNFKTLARRNNIAPPYRIYPGQTLLTSKPPRPAPSARPSAASRAAQAASAAAPVVTTPPAPAATAAAMPQPASGSLASAPPPPQSAAAPDDEPGASSVYDRRLQISWRWPLAGALARGFQEGGSKGIDIAAREGEPVAVAANGKVVYSGQGLIGYGNLVIVKHSDQYLSAYGNNSRLLVQEGDEVSAGQAIAEAGAANGRPPSLHFEIRRRGKPVNPLDYLPRH
jgi:lipoprotein NlpD